MMSMWTAPSDLDYYEQSSFDEPEGRCDCCGAEEIAACEEWCEANLPAEEPEDPDEEPPGCEGRMA
jgi:hypothetical protein